MARVSTSCTRSRGGEAGSRALVLEVEVVVAKVIAAVLELADLADQVGVVLVELVPMSMMPEMPSLALMASASAVSGNLLLAAIAPRVSLSRSTASHSMDAMMSSGVA